MPSQPLSYDFLISSVIALALIARRQRGVHLHGEPRHHGLGNHFFGRLASLKEAALAQFLATEESRKATQISLVGAVANGWLTVLADDELLALTRQTLDTREESVRLTKLRFDNGVASEIDFQLANSLAESARLLRAAAAPADAGRERARAAAGCAGAGGSPGRKRQRPGRRAADPRIAGRPAVRPAGGAARHPRRRAAADRRQCQHRCRAGRVFPAGGADHFNRHRQQRVLELISGTRAWAFSPQITLPIFDAGRNQAGLDSARAGREIAVAQYEKEVLQWC